MTAGPKRVPEVGILLYPGCQLSMVHGMTDMMVLAGAYARERGGPVPRISHWAQDGGGRIARVYDSDSAVAATHEASTPAVVIVPARIFDPIRPAEAEAYRPWLRTCHGRGATIAASCTGTFVLGEAGLLDGRNATTHWSFADAFRARFPKVLLDIDRIVVDDGEILTGAGIMAWTDLGLRLVDRLLGPTVMAETGQCMLIDTAGREQRHYARFVPRLTHGDDAIREVQHWLQARHGRAVSVAEMAGIVALGERTFLRRFKAATGLTPIEYAQNLRIGKARELLEFTRRSVEQIAWSVGYEDAAAFRKLFHRIVGLAPGDYRQTFAVGATAQAA